MACIIGVMTYIKCIYGNPYVYHSTRHPAIGRPGDEFYSKVRVTSDYQMPYRKWLKLGYGRLDVNVYRLPKPCLRKLMKFEADAGLVK